MAYAVVQCLLGIAVILYGVLLNRKADDRTVRYVSVAVGALNLIAGVVSAILRGGASVMIFLVGMTVLLIGLFVTDVVTGKSAEAQSKGTQTKATQPKSPQTQSAQSKAAKAKRKKS